MFTLVKTYAHLYNFNQKYNIVIKVTHHWNHLGKMIPMVYNMTIFSRKIKLYVRMMVLTYAEFY